MMLPHPEPVQQPRKRDVESQVRMEAFVDHTSTVAGNEEEFGLGLVRCRVPMVLWQAELILVVLRVQWW